MAALKACAPLLLLLLLGVVQGLEKEELIAEDPEAERVENKQYWSPECPSQFDKYWSAQNIASVCFYVSSYKHSWLSAQTACRNLAAQKPRCHGDLASVMNSAENEFVRNSMGSLGVNDHAWIGYNDWSYEGWFRWTDGRQSSWTNFYPGEPNDGGDNGEDCVELMHGYGGRWNDRHCDDEKYFICKAYCV